MTWDTRTGLMIYGERSVMAVAEAEEEEDAGQEIDEPDREKEEGRVVGDEKTRLNIGLDVI